MPRAATAPASMPPAGLAGSRPGGRASSTCPRARSPEPRPPRTWHLLDNGPRSPRPASTPVGTVLCVHGNPTWSYLWRRLVARATDARPSPAAPPGASIAVDQLDMGFSERTGVERDLHAAAVADLADLTDALELDGPVVTLGHDWGGVVSMGWAVDHPDLLAGVMLLNTAIHQPETTTIPAPLRARPSAARRARPGDRRDHRRSST